MVVVPLSKPAIASEPAQCASEACSVHWVRIAAAGTLIASGALLLGGKRRAGLLAAATGTSLALLDQQEALRSWWKILPCYIGDVQRLLDHVQGTLDDIAGQREKLGRALGR
jgi:hypothetical protein